MSAQPFGGLVPLLAILLAAPALASGQEFRGGIAGRVSDTSSARLPGATVTATNTSTNVASTTTTNSEGSYAILYLTPGIYAMSVELAGFKKVLRDGIEVRVGDRLTLDFTLDVGRLEETVSVRAESPLLDLAIGVHRTGDRREAHRADAALRRQPLRAVAAGARRRLHRRSEVLAPVRQRRHVVDQRRRIDRRQRVHARRVAEHGQRPARGVRAARRRRAGIQGADRELRRRRRPYRRRDGERHAQERHQRAERRGLLLPARRIAVGHRLLRQQERRRRSRRSTTSASADRSAGRCGCRACSTATTGPSSSARSSGSTTSSRSRGRRRCRRWRCATATSRRCSRRASSIYDPATAQPVERRAWCGRRFPATSFRRTASTRSRSNVLRYYPDAEPAGDASGTQQLLLRQPAHRRLLLDLDARRSPAHRQAADVRAATRATIAASRAARSSAR